MSVAGKAFANAFGAPEPATPNGITLGTMQSVWMKLHKEIGSGWFRKGFLYLLGDGMDAFQPCLEAWSFLVPPCADRKIVGRNAYGALLVLDHSNTIGLECVSILDPFTVTFTKIPNTDFISLLARALPKVEVPDFLDDRAYRDWLQANRVDRLELGDILGIKVPRALGGELVVENLQLDSMIDYYQTTAPIYAEAFARVAAQRTESSR